MFSSSTARLFGLTLFCLVAPFTFRLVSAQETPPLEVGKPTKRDLQSGQAHSYRLTLGAGQFLNLTVEQQQMDVEVVVVGPDGKPLLKVDSPNGKQGIEPLSLVSEVDGMYQIILQTLDANAQPGAYEITLHALRPATPWDQAVADAFKLYLEGLTFTIQKQPNEAVACEEKALARLAQQFGDDISSLGSFPRNVVQWYAELLSKKGRRAETKSDYAAAIACYQRAHVWLENKFGKDNVKTLNALDNLVYANYFRGEYSLAAQILGQILETQQRIFPAESVEVTSSLTSLGAILYKAGDYVRAEQLYRQTKAIWEKLGKKEVNESLNGLALIQLERGDYEQAEQLWKKVLAGFQADNVEFSENKATMLSNVGGLYYRKGDYEQAEHYQTRALEMRRKIFSPEHQEVAFSLNLLGDIYYRKGETTKAQEHYRTALEMLKKTVGEEHPHMAYALNRLAVIARDNKDYAQAEALAQAALRLRKKLLGEKHPEVAETLGEIALLYRNSGDAQKALTYQAQANEINETNLKHNLVVGSERQKLSYLALFSNAVNTTLGLHAQGMPESRAAAQLALETILRNKGRGLDAMADTIATLRRHANAEQQNHFDRLLAARSQLANLTVRGLSGEKPTTYRAQLKRLGDEIDHLEAELSRRCTEFSSELQPITLPAIQALLPRQTRLLEFATYQPYQAGLKTSAPARYLAYILSADGTIHWQDLGAVNVLDRAVDELRQALRNPVRKDVMRLARKVDEQLMQPLRALLGDASHLLISPDGMLNLLPFAALVDEQNRYLLERYTISYLTSGRDLLRLQVARAPKTGPLIVADPDFGLPPPTVALAQSRSIARRATLRGVYKGDENFNQWIAARLSETTKEAAGIKALLPQATVLLRQDATKTALKKLTAPSILHIATHGFFLPDAKPASDPLSVNDPLLRSGLLLAGFNLHKSGEDNGVLTAKEAAGLDLWGTELVVLSACDTGVGEVRNGDGVYGLRRALALAGAKTQVMSLWPVDEVATREWMTAYYAGLHLGRGEALRQVQLQLLQQKHRQHPFYWASFIQSGEWANLEGQR